MINPSVSLALMVAALAACSGPRKTARVEPLAPPVAPLIAERLAVLEPLRFEPIRIEPLGCPIYGADDRPDYDAQGLKCLVDWLREAQGYLAGGGKPTAHTNADSIKKNRATALVLGARVAAWLRKPDPDAASMKKRDERPVATPLDAMPSADSMASQQHFLNGIIYFQKGDYTAARKEWLLAKKLDPSNTDAVAALSKLDMLQ